MFGVVLFIQSIVTDQNNNFQQNFFIEDIDFLNSNLKRYFTSISIFCKVLGV